MRVKFQIPGVTMSPHPKKKKKCNITQKLMMVARCWHQNIMKHEKKLV